VSFFDKINNSMIVNDSTQRIIIKFRIHRML